MVNSVDHDETVLSACQKLVCTEFYIIVPYEPKVLEQTDLNKQSRSRSDTKAG